MKASGSWANAGGEIAIRPHATNTVMRRDGFDDRPAADAKNRTWVLIGLGCNARHPGATGIARARRSGRYKRVRKPPRSKAVVPRWRLECPAQRYKPTFQRGKILASVADLIDAKAGSGLSFDGFAADNPAHGRIAPIAVSVNSGERWMERGKCDRHAPL